MPLGNDPAELGAGQGHREQGSYPKRDVPVGWGMAAAGTRNSCGDVVAFVRRLEGGPWWRPDRAPARRWLTVTQAAAVVGDLKEAFVVVHPEQNLCLGGLGMASDIGDCLADGGQEMFGHLVRDAPVHRSIER